MYAHSLLLMGPYDLQWVEEPLHEPHPHEVVLETLVGAISVGTELALVRGVHRGTHPITYPKMTGYESVAKVIACGSDVQHLTVGDRVVAFYGHRTHAVLPAARVIPIPSHIPSPLAVLVILACDVTKGITKLQLQSHERVLITGAGTIGLLTVFNLQARAVQQIDVVEPQAHRGTLATELGAHVAVTPNEIDRLEKTYPIGIECSSKDSAFTLLQQRMEHAGRICILADGNLEPLILTPVFHAKELCVVGSSDGEDYQAYAQWFWPQAQKKASTLQRLFEQVTDAQRLVQTFADITRMSQPPIKVLIQYSE